MTSGETVLFLYMVKNLSEPVFFPTPLAFRNWLEKNYDKATELLVGFYKTGSGKASISWSESVDVAICFGWIDGIRKSIDDESYSIRFTPRKPKSIWSAVNIRKVEELTRQGLMHPAGLAAFSKREESKSRVYAYEKEATILSEDFLKQFTSNKKAWNYFKSMPPSYQKTAIHWVMDAKQEITKEKRLKELIEDSQAERKIKRLSY